MAELQTLATRAHKTVYRDGDKAVKVFDETFQKSDILNEAVNQARVEETGLNIPKLLEVSKVDGKWAITSEYVEGKTMEQLMDENPDQLEAFMEQLVDLQLEMHTKKAPLLNKLKDKMTRKISEADLDASTRYELHTRIDSMPKHHKVCHGDFNPSNIIIGADGKASIIDWSHATQGNASADAARTYLLFALKDEKKAELYLKLFCSKSDTAKQYVQQWLPIVAASQLTKCIPEERDFLMKWIDIFDFQ